MTGKAIEEACRAFHTRLRPSLAGYHPSEVYRSEDAEFVDAIRAAIAAYEAALWQPIDSAPKDGKILVASPLFEGTTFIARYDDDRYANKPRPYWSFVGQKTTTSRAGQPTHWRPLPPPPKGEPQ